MTPKRRQAATSSRSEPSGTEDPPRDTAPRRRRGRWSTDEVAHLRRHYGLRTEEQIARDLGRSLKSVQDTAARVFEARTRRGAWSPEEIEKLKDYVGASSTSVIARILGRSAADVERQLNQLSRVRRSGRWSHDEVQRLRRIYGRRTDEDLSIILGRSVESVRRQAARYALAKDKAFVRRLKGASSTRMPRWSDDELELLRNSYSTESNLEIARRLSRSVKSVVSKAHHLGLKKDGERLREMGRENVSRRYSKP